MEYFILFAFFINFCIFFFNFGRRHRDAESLENIAMRSSDSAPSTPEDNINVVVRWVFHKCLISINFYRKFFQNKLYVLLWDVWQNVINSIFFGWEIFEWWLKNGPNLCIDVWIFHKKAVSIACFTLCNWLYMCI